MDHAQNFLALVEEAKKRITEITPEQANEKLQATDTALIDVRELDEWTQGHLPNALHLSKGILERDIEKTIPKNSKPIIVYCGGGYRSAISADNLQKMGYKEVYSMQGGIKRWANEGYPLAFD